MFVVRNHSIQLSVINIFLFTRLQFSYKIYFQPNKNINSTCAIITRRNIHNGYTVA